MRIDFTVLWIDDQPETMKSYREGLALWVREHGFDLKVRQTQTVEEAKTHLGDNVFADLIDLVLVDFDLGKDKKKGSAELTEIRRHLGHRDIILYSAKGAGELRRMAYEAGADGVSFSSRDTLVETAKEVFATLVKKVLDLDHNRGIVMGATSEIDHLVHDVLLHLHEKMEKNDQAALLNDVRERILRRLKDLTEKAEAAKTGSVEYAFELHDLMPSYERLRILAGVLKKSAEHNSARDQVIVYMDKVVPDRTLLAHVRSQPSGNGRVLKTRDGKKVLTEDNLRELRKSLIDHRASFDALKARVTGA